MTSTIRWAMWGSLCASCVLAGWFAHRSMPTPQIDHELADEDKDVQLRAKDTQLKECRRALQDAQREIGEQRQLIREHALTKTARSVEELLGLFPAKFPQGNWRLAETLFEDCWFQTLDGLRLHGWYLPHEKPRAVLLYAHGNAGSVTHWAATVRYLHDRFQLSVMCFDYRGYGRSEGTPTFEGLLRDARAARDYLAAREELRAQDVVLLGRSLGGAVVVDLAARDGARGLVLECTFSTLRDVAITHYPKTLVNVLVAEKLDSTARIAQYHGPVLQCHGDCDRTIPLGLGQKLFAAANEPKRFVQLPGADHNDSPSEEYFRAFEAFLEALPPVGK